jgi:hypothetical protein
VSTYRVGYCGMNMETKGNIPKIICAQQGARADRSARGAAPAQLVVVYGIT